MIGYLPLALEIAAASARRRPDNLVRVVDKLSSGPMFGVLKRRVGEPRQKEVEATLAVSYDELNAEMQRRFRALGAFALAPFDATAVAAVWSEQDTNIVAEALDDLEALALVSYAEESNVYRQHDLLREYALVLLEREGELATVRGRHAAYYQALAESGDWRATEFAFEQLRQGWENVKESGSAVYDYFQAVKPFLERRRWAECLERGRDALGWVRQVENHKAEGRLLSDIGYIHWKEAYYTEALRFLLEGLAILQETKYQLQEAVCLNRIGLVYREQNRWTEALDYFERSLTIHQQIGSELGEGYALHNIGLALFYQSQLDEALAHLRRSLDIFDKFVGASVRAVDHEDRVQAQEGKALVLNTMGRVYFARQQYDEAMDLWQRSLAMAWEIGDRAGESGTLHNVGCIYLTRGELDKALECFQDSLAVSQGIGHRRAEGRVLNAIGEVSCLLGQYQEALTYCQQALAIHRETGDRKEEAIVLVNIGQICFAQGAWDQALNHFQCGLSIAQEIGDRLGEGIVLSNASSAYEKIGRLPEAEAAREQAAAIFKQLDIPTQEGLQQLVY